MYLRRFYFIILVYANLKMEYDTKDKTFWKRKGNDMKVLLGAVNAKYIHSNLAVYCLKAYAEKNMPQDVNVQIELAEYTINQNRDEILKDIYRRQAEMICFSCYIWNLDYVESMIRDVKKVMKDVIIWAGGPEVSYDSRETLGRLPELTGVMKGEGEKTFAKLCKVYGKSSETSELSLEQIDGITFRCPDGTICERPWRVPMDLSEVPFVYHDMKKFENKIIYYESSRGCPFSCSYCLSSIDKKLRFRDLELVKKELQFFLDHRVPQVKFVDRTFNCKHEHAMTIWKYILEHDNGITNFHFEVSADLLRDEEMQLMSKMRPGLIQLEIGVQSTNPDTIHAIHRHMDLDKLERCVAKVHSFGNIHQHLDLIAGLPYEDYDTFHRSFNDVYRMKPDQLQLGFLKVLKGSLMEKEAEKYGIMHKEKEPYEVLSTNWLSYKEVLRLKMAESMVEVYYNSGQFQNTLEYLVPQFADAFTFYEKLGAFYEKKGYSEISHSRMRRYEILLEFLREETDLDADVAAQHMLYDLYLREKLKKRPSFAADQKPYESAVWTYRKKHKISKTAHIEVFPDGTTILFDYENRNPLSNNAHTETIELDLNNVE